MKENQQPMLIRKSTELDFDRIMAIYKCARKYMAGHGNPNQWGPTNWPPAALIHNDIKDGNSYVCVNGEGTVIGTFCINWRFDSADICGLILMAITK